MTRGHGLFAETLLALLAPRRLIPIVLVCTPLVAIQMRYSRDPPAGPLAIVMCVLFVVLAPLTFRALVPAGLPAGRLVARFAAYAGIGAAVVMAIGVLVPNLTGVGRTFLTAPESLAVCLAFYLVGGWGLARDIGQEQGLERERARAAALAREVERTHLLALRSHLDPHFLFNSLNAIAEWCREDGKVAEQAVLRLATMLRSVLEGVKSSSWPLAKEIELAQDLFAMHRLRDPEAFELDVEVPEELGTVPVPPMLLLPLAENAVKHGPSAGHRGRIELAVVAREDDVLVTLENPGPYRGQRAGSDGLPTLQRRLALAYGPRARFVIGGVEGRTVVELTLPLSGPLAEAA